MGCKSNNTESNFRKKKNMIVFLPQIYYTFFLGGCDDYINYLQTISTMVPLALFSILYSNKHNYTF